jgi:natural product precursor
MISGSQAELQGASYNCTSRCLAEARKIDSRELTTHQKENLSMPEPKRKKLSLNQETLRNLSADELRNVAGGFASSPFFTCKCTTGLTCPECNPPVRREE